MRITKARLKEIIQEELVREAHEYDITEDPLESLQLAIEEAANVAQKTIPGLMSTPQRELAENILSELVGLLEVLQGL
tara:strand:+ start:476 stop:709 length:234 start_codon:yes stop_codon:yes gene_type:complete